MPPSMACRAAGLAARPSSWERASWRAEIPARLAPATAAMALGDTLRIAPGLLAGDRRGPAQQVRRAPRARAALRAAAGRPAFAPRRRAWRRLRVRFAHDHAIESHALRARVGRRACLGRAGETQESERGR